MKETTQHAESVATENVFTWLVLKWQIWEEFF